MRSARSAVLVAVAAMLVVAPTASADDTQCVGALTGTFDNVVVPADQTCFLTSSLVRGNVKALPDSRLFSDSNDIRGNVEGDKADQIDIFDFPGSPGPSIVGGNIEAKEGGGSTGAAFNPFVRVCGTQLPNGNIQVEKFRPPAGAGASFVLIGDESFCSAQGRGGGNLLGKGNIKVEENTITATMAVDQNQVRGNLQVFKNTGPGDKTVNANTGGGDLQCFDNSLPFNGAGNTFPKEEGQCS
jgi:hypothetical protein